MINSQIIKDYAEFSGLTVEGIVWSSQNFQILNKENFHQHKDAQSFYESSDTYIFDLFNANYDQEVLRNKINLFSPGLVQDLSFKPMGTKFLEFGGGLGVFCELVKKTNPGIDVTYCDIASKISDFTLWRYKKHNVNIDTLIIPQDDFELPGKYDIIFTDAVIEHLPSEQQERYMKKISSSLNNGGSFLCIVDLEGENPDMPMHYNVDIHRLHSILESEGMVCTFGRNTFSSRWINLSFI